MRSVPDELRNKDHEAVLTVNPAARVALALGARDLNPLPEYANLHRSYRITSPTPAQAVPEARDIKELPPLVRWSP